jgi:hypothetical protein
LQLIAKSFMRYLPSILIHLGSRFAFWFSAGVAAVLGLLALEEVRPALTPLDLPVPPMIFSPFLHSSTKFTVLGLILVRYQVFYIPLCGGACGVNSHIADTLIIAIPGASFINRGSRYSITSRAIGI